MNLLYERLIDAFISKAKIERDAHQIAQTLKQAYPECTLPVEKTIKRFLSGETHNPRDTFLGFLAAYILDETAENVLKADRNNTVGAFYETFLQMGGGLPLASFRHGETVKQEENDILPPNKDRKTAFLLWFFALLTVALIGYIVFLKRTRTPMSSIESPSVNSIRIDTVTVDYTKKEGKKLGTLRAKK
jgi:hypothetical protein